MMTVSVCIIIKTIPHGKCGITDLLFLYQKSQSSLHSLIRFLHFPYEVLNLYMSQKYRLCLDQQQNRIKADGTFSSNVKDTD